MPNENQQALEGEQLLDAITRHVFLVMLHISWPKMSYKIADAIVEVKVEGNGKTEEEKKEIAEEFRTKPQWQLMPTEWRKRLGNLEGRARSLLSHASIQFAARGMAVLPVARAKDIFQGLRALRAEMEQCRDEFVADYEDILATLEEKLEEDLFKKVQGKLPDSDEVADKFGIVWAIIPAGGRTNLNETQMRDIERAINDSAQKFDDLKQARPRAIKNALTALKNFKESEAQRERQITDDEANELVDEAREQMHKFTQEMLQDMAREPRQVLMDAADNLMAALKDPDRIIRNGTINQVREAFEMVEGFEFLAGPELLRTMRECRQRLDNVTPQMLNGDAEIGAALAAGLQGVRNEAADAEESSNAVRRFRGIKLRNRPKKPVAA